MRVAKKKTPPGIFLFFYFFLGGWLQTKLSRFFLFFIFLQPAVGWFAGSGKQIMTYLVSLHPPQKTLGAPRLALPPIANSARPNLRRQDSVFGLDRLFGNE